MHEKTKEPKEPENKARRWRWRRVIFIGLAALAGLLVWLDGPGIRWLVPRFVAGFLENAGLSGSYRIEGRVSGGLTVRDLDLTGDGPVKRIRMEKASVDYRLRGLADRQIDGIEVSSLHIELDLAAERKTADPEPGKEPFDLAKLATDLRAAREQIVPLDIGVSDLRIDIARGSERVFSLDSSALDHATGSGEIRISLGTMTDAGGREWPQQEAVLTWRPEELEIDRIDLLRGIGVEGLVLRMPADAPVSASASLVVDDARIAIEATPGFESLSLDLMEGAIPVAAVAERLAFDSPVAATLTSLSVIAEDFMDDPKRANGGVRLLFEDVEAAGWLVPELNLDLNVDAAAAELAASANALGTTITVSARLPVDRSGKNPRPGELNGHLTVADASALVSGLAERVPAIDPESPLPPSVLDGPFRLDLTDWKPGAAACDLALRPAEPADAASLFLTAGWRPDGPLVATLRTEGAEVSGSYQFDTLIYQGEAVFDGFQSARIDRWLRTFRIDPGVALALAEGEWIGGGDFRGARHHGEATLRGLDLRRSETPPLLAAAAIRYDWPGSVTLRELQAEAGEQRISGGLRLENDTLEITGLRWWNDGREIASIEANLPVPPDFGEWREWLATEQRPLDLQVKSETLPLSLLEDWLPVAETIDPGATGRIDLAVAGLISNPDLSATIEVRGLGVPEQPHVPPTDLVFSLRGSDGSVTLDGEILTPDYAPAVVRATMPLRPAAWAADPDLLLNEPLRARIDLPRVEISRFVALIPALETLRGTLDGHLEAAGTVAKPEVSGRLGLTGGSLEFKDRSLPAVTGISARVEAEPSRVALRDLRAAVAGGSVEGGGTLNLGADGPGELDFRLTARHLPIKRDDSLIVRASADLRLAGPWESAAVTGTAEVVDSLFFRDIEILPIGTPFVTPSAASLPRLDAPAAPAAVLAAPFGNWSLDVRVRTGNPFLIRGNIATGRLDADLRVGGTLARPEPTGEVTISRFRAALPFSTLEVRSGRLIFEPARGFDPMLEIRGTAEPRPYRVNMYVYGSASDPKLLLTSSPPLPENEIMTLLATGTTTSGLEDPQAASARVLQLFAEEVRRGRFAVGRQLRPLLGLVDRVDFSLAESDPYTSEKFSTATLKLSDRWYLSAGMNEEGESRVLGIWRLTFR